MKYNFYNVNKEHFYKPERVNVIRSIHFLYVCVLSVFFVDFFIISFILCSIFIWELCFVRICYKVELPFQQCFIFRCFIRKVGRLDMWAVIIRRYHKRKNRMLSARSFVQQFTYSFEFGFYFKVKLIYTHFIDVHQRKKTSVMCKLIVVFFALISAATAIFLSGKIFHFCSYL